MRRVTADVGPLKPKKQRGYKHMKYNTETHEMEMSKDERRALDALRAAEISLGWSRARAYVVLSPDRKRFGKIKILYPADGAGRLRVFAWDCSGDHGLQYGHATGGGYDKLSAALCGMKWDGLVFGDHCQDGGPWDKMLKDAGYEIIQAL